MKFRIGLLFVVTSVGLTGVGMAQGIRERVHNRLFGTSPESCAAGSSCGVSSAACAQATVAAPAKAAAGPIRSGIVHEFVRLKVAAELRKKGKSVSEAHTLAGSLSDQMIEAAAGAVGAPGGFFQQLLADLMLFLQSPQGQQLLAALMQMLLGLLGAQGPAGPIHGADVFTMATSGFPSFDFLMLLAC